MRLAGHCRLWGAGPGTYRLKQNAVHRLVAIVDEQVPALACRLITHGDDVGASRSSAGGPDRLRGGAARSGPAYGQVVASWSRQGFNGAPAELVVIEDRITYRFPP